MTEKQENKLEDALVTKASGADDPELKHEKVAAPTGDEQPQTHYRSAYLDQVDAIKREVARAGATGTAPKLDGFHPVDLAAAGVTAIAPEDYPEIPEGSAAWAALHQGEGQFTATTTESRTITDTNDKDTLAKIQIAEDNAKHLAGKQTDGEPGTRDPSETPAVDPEDKVSGTQDDPKVNTDPQNSEGGTAQGDKTPSTDVPKTQGTKTESDKTEKSDTTTDKKITNVVVGEPKNGVQAEPNTSSPSDK